MDYDKLYSLTKEKIFTDLSLTLIDRNNNHITIDVNKNILYASCIYFEKLLTNFKEKNSNSITIEVSNAYVMYDVIMSFYGQKTNLGSLPQNKHLLESIICCNFLGLEFKQSVLDNMEVLEEDFELFLSVIDLIGYDDRTIRLINKNMSKNYDSAKLSKELLNEMLLSQQSYYVATGSYDNDNIKIWSAKGQLIGTLIDHSDCVLCICVSPDNKHIASGSEDCSINIWDAETNTLIKTLREHMCNVCCLCYSPNGKQLTSGGDDNKIKIWDTKSYNLLYTFNNASGNIRSICYSSDSLYIISAANYCIDIWDAINGEFIINSNHAHNEYIKSVIYSHDNKHIISGSLDHTIKIWDINTLAKIRTISEHSDVITCLCCSSDNKYFASASFDCTIKLWDMKTYELVKIFPCSYKPCHICFSPDNNFIISDDEKNIYTLNIETGILVNSFDVCRISCIQCFGYHCDGLEQRIIESLKEN